MNTIDKTVCAYISSLDVRVTCKPAGFDNSPAWQSDMWSFTLSNGAAKVSFSYRTGLGLRAEGKPVKPDVEGLLYSLLLDAQACEQTHAEWCADFGYSPDSIKERKIYRACVANGMKLATIFSAEQIARLSTLLQDY